MARRTRYIPPNGALVEVTCRTVQGRHLLRPDPEVNQTIQGVLARALEPHPTVELHAISVLSNHLHMLLSVDHQQQLTQVMQYFGSHSTRKLNPIVGWSGSLWQGRYRAICVSEEPKAQIARLEYLLAQGVKENLVETVADWPGVHSGKVLGQGRSVMVGTWVDGTRRYQASLRGEQLSPEECTITETVELKPLPCWQDLSWREYTERIQEMIRRIEARAAEERALTGTEVLGAEAVLRHQPHERPPELKTSPAPLVHAATRKVRLAWMEAYSWFLERYREASEQLRNGDRKAVFPEGCYPPRLPFVGTGAGGMPLQPVAG